MSQTYRFHTATVSRYISHAAVALLCLAGGSAAKAEPSIGSPAIILINPNSNAAATESMRALAQEAAGGEARILGRTNDNAPRLLTTPEDMGQAVTGVVEIGRQAAAEEGVVAIIVSAFSDPGLAELREAVPDTVVVGIGEQAFHEAAKDGRSFAIVTITPDPELIESFRAGAEELVEKPEQLDTALAGVVEQAVREDGAEAVIVGGGLLSAPARRIQSRFDVPLVVAVTAATNAALMEIKQ